MKGWRLLWQAEKQNFNGVSVKNAMTIDSNKSYRIEKASSLVTLEWVWPRFKDML